MAIFSESIHIERSPEEVWSVIGDPAGISGWLPFLTKSRLEGEYRLCEAGENGALRERILRNDDEAFRTEYTILEGPMPIEFIHAGIEIEPEGEGSRVVWDTTVTPDELVDAFRPIYREGLENLKVRLET